MVKKERAILRHVEAMLEPKHLFILPEWADPLVLDRLLKQGHLTCSHEQRDEQGTIYLIMGLHITESGNKLLHPLMSWHRAMVTTTMVGVTCTALNLVVLYWG